MTGVLIALEGIEAGGKSRQARLLVRRLQREGYPTLLVKEPGGTPLGERLRRLLKFFPGAMTPRAELLLFLASRAQLVEEVIGPALREGRTVVCDRFSDSTLAYQGFGRGLDLSLLRRWNQWATGGLRPSLTVLLDIPVEEALRRLFHAGAGRSPRERFEGLALDSSFLQRVREGYLALARQEPERWLVVDGTLPVSEVHRRIWERVGTVVRGELL